MTLFELVKLTLDQLYEMASKRFGEKTDSEIRARIEYLTKQYAGLTNKDRAPIDYSDPATRFAYVYKYVAGHGDFLAQMFKLARAGLKTVFPKGTARLTAIGGGPGSDIIAALKYLNDCDFEGKEVKKLIVYLVDGEKAWADTWTELDEKMGLPISMSSHMQQLDVTDPKSWADQTNFLKADVFTLSFFVSEVYSLALAQREGLKSFWSLIFEGAKPGALFFYIDNSTDNFTSYFDDLCKGAKLKVEGMSNAARMVATYNEQKEVLQVYTDKFGSSPKVKSHVSWRILRKPLPE